MFITSFLKREAKKKLDDRKGRFNLSTIADFKDGGKVLQAKEGTRSWKRLGTDSLLVFLERNTVLPNGIILGLVIIELYVSNYFLLNC